MTDDTETGVALAAAGEDLRAFVEGPGEAAADALSAAFDVAGIRIADALGAAARTGEADFARLVEAVLADLARIATAQAIGGLFGGGTRESSRSAGEVAQSISITVNAAAGSDARSFLQSEGQIASALARAVRKGGRSG